MPTKIILFLLMGGFFNTLSGQNSIKGDTLRIEGNTVKVFIPKTKRTDEFSQIDSALQKELLKYTTEKKKENFISNNVMTQVDVKKEEKDLKVVYSYSLLNDTLKFQTDDFILGRYNVDASHAMQVTLEVMKNNVSGQLAKYITPAKEISITINGSADATPIRGSIPYKGEFGTRISENCLFEGKTHKMEASINQGITSNSTLAFVRSVAVKDYIKNNIFNNLEVKPTYIHSASVSRERGGQFRRVFIEMIIHNLFE
jgi:hypothetical protein